MTRIVYTSFQALLVPMSDQPNPKLPASSYHPFFLCPLYPYSDIISFIPVITRI